MQDKIIATVKKESAIVAMVRAVEKIGTAEVVEKIKVVKEIEQVEVIREVEIDRLAPFMPDIMRSLRDKGVNPSGELGKLADDIRQIQTITDIDPNKLFKVINQEEMLRFDLVSGYYTDASGRDLAYQTWSITSYIDIEGAEYVSMLNGSVQYSCYYDSNKKALGAMKSPVYDKPPANAKYIRISNDTNTLKKLEVKRGRFVITSK